MIWLEQVLEKIIKTKKTPILVSDYKTPSGKIHIGALRGVIIHDLVYKTLIENGKKAEFIYGFDDFDPMDSFPVYLSKDFKKYMAVPLSEIPSPEGGKESFARFYAQEFKSVFNKLGAKPKIIWTSELYKSGKFNKAIKIALENAPKIREIYLKISGSKKPGSWYPFQVVCPKCGKIGTTRVFNYKNDEVEFVCEKNLVSWAKGCGYKGKISPYNGNGKLPWKVEWTAKWAVIGTDFEAAGKDHYTRGGARDIAEAIAKEVYQIEPPVGIGYEFFLVSGKKMASSKGLGVAASEIAEILPPELLRFLMIKTPVQRPIEFNPEGETILRLYDAYDKTAEGDKNFHFRFSKAAFLLQMPNVDLIKKAAEEKGEPLTSKEEKDLEQRKKYAEKWLKIYAPENYKYELQEKLPPEAGDLSEKQREFLAQILEIFQKKDWQGEELHQEIHKIKENLKIDPREAFSAIYLIFFGKNSGPQAGWFLASLDKDFVIKRLKEVV